MTDWSHLRSTGVSLADGLAVDLERMIRSEQLKPGDRIPAERELAELAGVSRTSVREALHDLEMRGLVDRKPGRGTIVTENDRETRARLALKDVARDVDIFDVMDLRIMIEPPLASLAARRANSRDIAQLVRLVEEMSRPVDAAEFVKLDVRFHDAVARCTRNPLMLSLSDRIASLVEPSREGTVQSQARRISSIEGHRAILEAIRIGDPDEAYWAAAAHVESVREHIIENALAREASTDGAVEPSTDGAVES